MDYSLYRLFHTSVPLEVINLRFVSFLVSSEGTLLLLSLQVIIFVFYLMLRTSKGALIKFLKVY